MDFFRKSLKKSTFKIGATVVASVFLLPSLVLAQSVDGNEIVKDLFTQALDIEAEVTDFGSSYIWTIPSYDVDMKMRKDGVLEVTERIVADFSNTSRRGIIRDIPVRYGDFWNYRSISLSNVSITNEEGRQWEFQESNSGDNKSYRIGNPNIWYSEPLTYVIKYEVEGMLNSFDENGAFLEGTSSLTEDSNRDELYWNAIGTEWYESPIANFSVSIDLSEFDQSEVLEFDCFKGTFGEDDKNCNLERVGDILNVSGDNLGLRKGVTVGVAFKGGVIEPGFNIWLFLNKLKVLVFAFPALVLIWFYRHWKKHGKELDSKAVIPIYKIGNDLNAIEIGTLLDERLGTEDITAGIIELAVKGYLKIEEEPKKGLFGKKTLTFVKLKEADDSLLEFQKKLYEGIFVYGDRVTTKKLTGKFYITVDSVRRQVFDYLVDQGYYLKNPSHVVGKYIVLGTLATFGAIWGGAFFGTFIIPFILGPIALGCFVFGPFMGKKTAKGMDAYTRVLGFQEFIMVAEKDRIKFFQQMKDEMGEKDVVKTFEEMLPFAMALGMGDEWADIFSDIFTEAYSPVWYSGGTGRFDSNSFADSMNSLNSGMSRAGSPPSSSASSGGSFSSGGFSGGGFGGGGGSSW